jgi:hypothetical protein
MTEFEGFEGQTELQPSGNQFWARQGVDATPAPGNGSLPPGATETPDFTKRTPSVTKASFIKNTAA